MRRDGGGRRELEVTDAVVVAAIDALFEQIEVRYGFPVTEAPSEVELVQETPGRFKLYVKGRRHLQRTEA